jgi:hypothetical protein
MIIDSKVKHEIGSHIFSHNDFYYYYISSSDGDI